MYPFSLFNNPHAACDLEAYRVLMLSKGKELSDQALARLLACATRLYSIFGRIDFVTLQSPLNVGSGNKFYSFHGKEGTLFNGPSWGAEGVIFGGTNQYGEINLFPASTSLPFGYCYVNKVTEYILNGIWVDVINGTNDYDVFNPGNGGTSGTLYVGLRTNNTGTFSPWGDNGLTYAINEMQFFAEGYGAAGTHLIKLNAASASRAITSSVTIGSKVRFSRRADEAVGAFSKQVADFYVGFFRAPSIAIFNNIQTIYKATIGVDQGLP